MAAKDLAAPSVLVAGPSTAGKSLLISRLVGMSAVLQAAAFVTKSCRRLEWIERGTRISCNGVSTVQRGRQCVCTEQIYSYYRLAWIFKAECTLHALIFESWEVP